MDAVLCKIKLGMSIFFERYATKNAVQLDFTETVKCVHFTVLLSLFFQNHAVFQPHKSKNHNAKFINTANFKQY